MSFKKFEDLRMEMFKLGKDHKNYLHKFYFTVEETAVWGNQRFVLDVSICP